MLFHVGDGLSKTLVCEVQSIGEGPTQLGPIDVQTAAIGLAQVIA